MWPYRDGCFSTDQIDEAKKYMRRQIFFLLLYVDPKTKDKYENVDVVQAFDSVLTWFSGLNVALEYPAPLVQVISLLEAAKMEYQSPAFDFAKYRKLVLDAGCEVLKIKEVE